MPKGTEKQEIIEGLIKAYWMELETVMNYIANSSNLDGICAEGIKKSLGADIGEEVGHANTIARRVKQLGGLVPGSKQFKAEQSSLQPPKNTTDVMSVIKGVIDAEDAACKHYNHLIRLCDGIDYVTQDLCVRLLSDEEGHLNEFRGFLKECNKK